ncbi:UDP-glucose 4-epimerase [Pseudosporangium ferrugineum]|uniref:UDP-glucose 4-epimerase n=1 Tax=Pseudosporangium ferrugineum TaxID=439699 RepID=A0A2T0RDQ9_9ACTN|nr:UDP-glucose 4-epimerase [Pseudosporangium ferrugineum]
MDKVVALDNLSTGYAENLRGVDAELVVGSILDRDLLNDVVSDADAVVHLAARPSVPRSVADPVASHEANATGTLYVLEACRRRETPLIAASSSSVYGPTVELPKNEYMPTRPQSPYAASKLAAESYVLSFGATYKTPTLAFRFFNVYGPLQSAGHAYAAAIPAFVDAALRGNPLHVHGDGKQTRDFTFVGSVVKVLAEAAERGVRHDRPVNLAFGTRVSLLELIKKIATIADRDLKIEFEPPRAGDVRDSQASQDILGELFPGHTPVSLDEGLTQTIRWYSDRLQ